MRATPLLALLVALLLAEPAFAMSCGDWERLGPEQRAGTVEDMIQGAVSGSGGRSYGVDRGAIARCLRASSGDIAYAFDDACSDPRTAGMNAIRTTFKNFIWSCIR